MALAEGCVVSLVVAFSARHPRPAVSFRFAKPSRLYANYARADSKAHAHLAVEDRIVTVCLPLNLSRASFPHDHVS